MNITGNNNGSLVEVMSKTLENLRNADANSYLTSKVAGAKGKVEVVTANKRGFTIALDYSTNPTGMFGNPNGGNLPTTYAPALDRMTGSYQYIAFGHEVSGESLANSRSGMHVGATARALAIKKELERRMEFEEWFFCRGDGSQVIGDITAGVSISAAATGTLTLSGARDGAGAWMLRVGQRIRIYDVTLGTLRSLATVTAKTSNTAVSIVPDSNLTAGNAVVDTDVVLPEGDTTSPTTAGIKGLPYIVSTAATYFDKNRTNVPALKAVVDASTTTISRTTMEILRRQHKSIRNNGSVKTMIAVSPAQMSQYYAQFYAQNTAHVNVIGSEKPGIDIGANSEEYSFWGQKINEFKLLHPKNFWFVDPSSFVRLTLKEAGDMLTPAGGYLQKISSGQYVNAEQHWSDDYLEYLSANPAKNAGFTALTFSGLPLLKDDTFVG